MDSALLIDTFFDTGAIWEYISFIRSCRKSNLNKLTTAEPTGPSERGAQALPELYIRGDRLPSHVRVDLNEPVEVVLADCLEQRGRCSGHGGRRSGHTVRRFLWVFLCVLYWLTPSSSRRF